MNHPYPNQDQQIAALQQEREMYRREAVRLQQLVDKMLAERQHLHDDDTSGTLARELEELEQRVARLEISKPYLSGGDIGIHGGHHTSTLEVKEPYHGLFPPSHVSYEGAD